jgi:hypothetical protein
MNTLFKSGIYQIRNLNNNKKYIGSSVNILRRFNEHKSRLNRKIHKNIHLQRAFNKHGINCFVYEVLCYCTEEHLLGIEQYYLNVLNPEYNICKIAYSTLGTKQPNKFSGAALEKMSKAREGKARISVDGAHIMVKVNYTIKEEQNPDRSFSTIKEITKALNIPHSTVINGIKRKNKVYNKFFISRTKA